MKIFTMGYEGKSAETFFEILKKNNIQCLCDIRILPNSDDARFCNQRDLPYLLKELVNCEYKHFKQLAPTEELLNEVHLDHDWEKYVRKFTGLLDERDIPNSLDQEFFKSRNCCLLCFEATHEQCHRTLVSERLKAFWKDVEVINL